MASTDVVTRAVREAELGEVARLFAGYRNTKRCWCMAPCSTGLEFAVGWVTARNRRRFEAMTMGSTHPAGVVASVAGEPVGWCACGPRERYLSSPDSRQMLGDQPSDEHGTVWLVPCFVVRSDFRGRGLTDLLLRSAVHEATIAGATAIEGWPSAGIDPRAADAFRGRERLFADSGFVCTSRPTPARVIMRRDLLSHSDSDSRWSIAE